MLRKPIFQLPSRSSLSVVYSSSSFLVRTTTATPSALLSTSTRLMIIPKTFSTIRKNSSSSIQHIDTFCHDYLSSSNMQRHSADIESLLKEKSSALAKMEAEYETHMKSARKKVWWIGALLGLSLVGQWLLLCNWIFLVFDWNLIEPVTYFLAFSCAWFSVFFYCLTGVEWTYESINDVMGTRFANRSITKANPDFLKQLESLRDEIRELTAAENAIYIAPKTEKTIVL